MLQITNNNLMHKTPPIIQKFKNQTLKFFLQISYLLSDRGFYFTQ